MKKVICIFLLAVSIFAEEAIVDFKKGKVKIIDSGNTLKPRPGLKISLDAKVIIEDKGKLDFAYKGKTYRIKEQGEFVVSDIIKKGNSESKLVEKADTAGVRGHNPDKDKKKKKKKKDID